MNVTDVQRSVDWYVTTLGAKVLYQDQTWALLSAGGIKIALTIAVQHPGHVAFDIGPDPPEGFLKAAVRHRDGSMSRYVKDPDGNAIEWIHYPEGGR